MVAVKLADLELNLKQFNPVWPVLTGHTQTLLAHFLPSKTARRNWSNEIIKLPDGDELFIQFIDQKSTISLSLFHGLSGDSQSDYMCRTAEIGFSNGWNVILVNLRGAHPMARAEKTYHSGRGEDASEVIKWGRSKFENSKQVVVGFSVSGSILLNLLTGRMGDCLPDFAVVVNTPLRLEEAARRLSRGFLKIYDFRFYFKLRRTVKSKRNISLPCFGTLYSFDNLYTSVSNGYKNAIDYYENCSVFNYVGQTKIRTFVLSSMDDPMVNSQDYISAKWNENTHVTLLKYGGHMGYYSRDKDSKYGRRWLDHYLESVFNQIKTMI